MANLIFTNFSWTLIHFLLLLIMSPFVSPLSFNFSSIGPDNATRIKIQGNAYISQQGIEVTTQLQRCARATFIYPLHLWDKSSGNLADFATHFSFIIQSASSHYADGLTFFLAPADSRIPENSWGSGLGLAFRDDPSVPPVDPFVAVEFDTYTNDWDSRSPHVGIDVCSLVSAANTTWSINMTAGDINDAWISYDSTSNIIRVNFTSNKTRIISSLAHAVDLRRYLPEWVSIGFSAATGIYSQRHNIKSWDFSSSLELKTKNPIPNSTTTPERKKMKGGGGGVVIGLGVGLSVLVFGLILLGYFCWRKKNRGGESSLFDVIMENEFEKGCGGPKKFSYRELARATGNFAEEYKLGEGGFGGVYRGLLKDTTNSYVAVKRVSKSSKQGVKEYASEVKIISQLRHRNLVQLLGWCHEKRELLLVYEFLPNGSLDTHLFNQGSSSLTWETRYKIARGLASALLYLHQEWEQCVVHRDIKSSNVMLDSSFNAKLGDFGLARLVDHEKATQTTVLAGTLGYMAPECAVTGRASKESDVYSFGIVLLEIACGRRPVNPRSQENQVTLVEWVWSLYGVGQLLDAADPNLESEYDARETEQLMVVGLWCAHPNSSQRPSIREAIKVLNSEASLPLLPPVMGNIY